MDPLKQRFFEKSSALKEEMQRLLKEHGKMVVDEVTLSQIFGGARNIKMMVWDPSDLDPVDGIRFRGHSIPELRKLLPTGPDGRESRPEGLFWLLMVGEIPSEEDVNWLTEQWISRYHVPEHTFKVLDSLPAGTHPMTQFSVAISSMQTDSLFARRYDEGMNKEEFWDSTYEDAMNLIARLPRIAAYIYRRTYHQGKHIAPDYSLDWAGNFAHMLGIEGDDFKNCMRLYLTIHADHEGGNASAHTTHLVGSTLSDAYLAFSGGMNALAGPLHGLANQEVIKWIYRMLDALGSQNPGKDQIADYVNSTLARGQVIPGYGHAVLRQPDPRFIALKEFSEKNIKNSDLIEVVWKVFDVVPDILQGLGKVKNPWPNVDAHSGALLVHYGLKEYSFYTVLFGVARGLGVMSALCWARAMGFPLERPKSVTTRWVREVIAREKIGAGRAG